MRRDSHDRSSAWRSPAWLAGAAAARAPTSRSIRTPSAGSRPAPSARPSWAAASRRSTPCAPGPAHHLRRRGRRRRLEVDRRRPHLQAGLRRLRPVDRRHRHRSRRTRRPSGWAPASRGPATASRWATASTRSTDGGDSWQQVGLDDTERIARIQVSPADGNTVWVCATGHLWDSQPERGVYKTTDGGKTWKKVLYVDADTGCSDLAVDPQDPSILYAGMWQFRRTPVLLHAPAARAAASTSRPTAARPGGSSKTGLPAGDKGRIAVAVAPSRPSVVYALVEAEGHRPLPLGRHRRELAAGQRLVQRPGAAVLLRPHRGRSHRLQHASTSRA